MIIVESRDPDQRISNELFHHASDPEHVCVPI